ncbi:MAG: carbohydrate-binding domain-containing protein [[Clostridium] aminophilum]|uniref:carbohydrate-binding domain-containing protein n=1 Tax=[Clostridium] aminophilum TaxID=1526 RepID=UPI0026F21DEE|nr:carbohydrate-binding domain-containing protein [[Clostridium] aminophilum]MDD6197228.1 carbohydrate-binding domain-containing protein [[Clostridium] aminophilum]
MLKNKLTDRICIAATILAMVITVLFINGESLGLKKMVDADSDLAETSGEFTENDLNSAWDTASAVTITLEGSSGTVSGDGAYFLNGDLVIATPGKYVISGTLDDGSIIVDFEQKAKVWILLDGVDITCSDDACLRVNEADKVFLTLAEGSENRMHSGAEYSEEALSDGTGGVIYAHDDLTINGSGALTIEGDYKHGIEANDDLVIAGGTIGITCVQDGFHVNDSLKITGASITVNAGDDALHCDTEITIKSGTILLESCYEGIEAPTVTIDGGDITIYPTDDGINANGGENSFGMGVGPGEAPGGGPGGGMSMQPEMQDKAQKSAGEPDTAGTNETVADAAATPERIGIRTSQQVQKDENTESASDSDNKDDDVQPTITINGGTVTIINETGMDADGIDSNSDIIINGGTVFVSLSGSGPNNALDYGSENGGTCQINGGTVIACGGSAMLEEVSADSGQCSLVYVPEESAAAGSIVSILSASGETVLSREIQLEATALTLSSPELEQGQTYTVVISSAEKEDITTEVTFDEKVQSINVSGNAGFGGRAQMGGVPFGEADGAADSENSSESGFPQRGSFRGMRNFQTDETGAAPDSESAGSTDSAVTTILDYDPQTWAWMGACAVAIIAGIVFVKKY